MLVVPSIRGVARAVPLLALLVAACGSGERAGTKADVPGAPAGGEASAAEAPSAAEPERTPAHLERASLRVLGMT